MKLNSEYLVGEYFSGPSDYLRTPAEADRGLYSPDCLEEVFSETHIHNPAWIGSWEPIKAPLSLNGPDL
jgi:hypothetical protein